MRIFDEHGNQLESIDETKGSLIKIGKPVYNKWIIDEPEVKEEYVIAEYPDTGGKDIGYRTISEEIGHWETRDENGELIELDGFPDHYTSDVPKQDVEIVGIYHEYTESELEEMIEFERLQAEQQEKFEKRESWLEDAPSVQEQQDAAICDLYEAQVDLQEQMDDAICEIYELMIGE